MAIASILIADDDRNLSQTLAGILQTEGYEVTVVHDGQSALEAHQNITPDVMILDVSMPVLDGLEVCRRVRATDERVIILMLTAQRQVDDKVGALDQGADDYMTKPFGTRELLARLKSLLRRTTYGPPNP
ncbi:MAG TPA: response regulator transcription factor [Elusimicrobiota bacterium]|nr:response regulator transcription factor [Elusimicrobiota bacterium]